MVSKRSSATSDLATVVRAALAQAGVSDVISVDVTEGPPRACSQASQSNKTRRWALDPRSIALAKARTDAPPTFKRRSLAADEADAGSARSRTDAAWTASDAASTPSSLSSASSQARFSASGTPASSSACMLGASAASWAQRCTRELRARTLLDKVEAAPTSDAVESATSAPRSSDASSFDGAWRPKRVLLNVDKASIAVRCALPQSRRSASSAAKHRAPSPTALSASATTASGCNTFCLGGGTHEAPRVLQDSATDKDTVSAPSPCGSAARRQHDSDTRDAKSFGDNQEQALAISRVGTFRKAPADMDSLSAMRQ
mmetsp:Transcript_12270/g.36675  ORF Transcript_12270/g.36675 Transcript_12270/m.36675 type:complete len:316 (+) Transcript_12270:527-1474(+)